MKNSSAQHARQLYLKAENDLAAAKIGLQHGAPLDTVCFHIQQTAEKLRKAVLSWKGVEYPFTHDLRDLLELALKHFAELERFRDTLPEYTEFAVKLRYDELPSLSKEEAETAFGVVSDLRDWVRIEFRTLLESG
jgi:HEPN domain-containing protein